MNTALCTVGAACVMAVAWPSAALARDAGPAAPAAPADAGVPAAGSSMDAGPASGASGGDAGVKPPGQGQDGGADPGVLVPDGLPPGFIPPEAIASPGVEEVQLGRPFSVFISVTHPKDVRVNLPTMIPSLRGAFDELRRTSGTSKRLDGTPVREFELEVIPWIVGNLKIPPIELTYVVDGKVHRIRTKAVPVKVISVIGTGEEKLRDIVPPVDVTRRDWFLLYLLGGLGAVLVGGFTTWRFRRVFLRRPVRRRPAPVAVSLSADAEALSRLAELEASGALDVDDRKPAYVELSHIVRRYLSRRFGFPALELTTGEIGFRLSNVPGGDRAIELMGDVLELADFAKYAGYESRPDEARAAVQTARGLVEGTRYVAPPPPRLPATPAPAPHAPVASAPAAPPAVLHPDTLVDTAPRTPAPDVDAAADVASTLIDTSSPVPDMHTPAIPDAAAPPTLVDTPGETLKWPAAPGDEGQRDA